MSTFSAGSQAGGQAVEIKQQWRVGKHDVLAVETEHATTIGVAGQKMDQKMNRTVSKNVHLKTGS